MTNANAINAHKLPRGIAFVLTLVDNATLTWAACITLVGTEETAAR